jgi:hypothetical protein
MRRLFAFALTCSEVLELFPALSTKRFAAPPTSCSQARAATRFRQQKNIMQSSAGVDVTLIHSAYAGADEIGLKMIDYSADSIRMRRNTGYREGQRLARTIGDMPGAEADVRYLADGN